MVCSAVTTAEVLSVAASDSACVTVAFSSGLSSMLLRISLQRSEKDERTVALWRTENKPGSASFTRQLCLTVYV